MCVRVCVNRYISRVVLLACIICVAIVTAHENPRIAILLYCFILLFLFFFFLLGLKIIYVQHVLLLFYVRLTCIYIYYNTSSRTTYNYIYEDRMSSLQHILFPALLFRKTTRLIIIYIVAGYRNKTNNNICMSDLLQYYSIYLGIYIENDCTGPSSGYSVSLWKVQLRRDYGAGRGILFESIVRRNYIFFFVKIDLVLKANRVNSSRHRVIRIVLTYMQDIVCIVNKLNEIRGRGEGTRPD